MKKKPGKIFKIEMLPDFIRMQKDNPKKALGEQQVAIMYGRAIHWLSILEILSPPFEEVDSYFVEVSYLVINDPDEKDLPVEFFRQLAQMVSFFWTLQLQNLYPNGEWVVEIFEEQDMLVQADIYKRG